MQERVTANGYLWDYDTEKSQSEQVSGEGVMIQRKVSQS